jgi:3-phosphoshikimate 1-carboxyvinyltransferase
LFEDLVSGKVQLSAGVFSVDAGISSQFISGLLFALPLLDGDSELRLTGKAESVPYIDLTVDMLNKFGIDVAFDGEAFYIPGKQHYRSPEKIQIEGDWSNAAFWLAAGIEVTGLDYNSKQGDRAIAEILEDFRSSIDVSDIPDLVPILSVVAASRKGTTTIRNAGRLRIKESDRLAAVTELLTTLGADVTEMEDSLVIRGGKPLKGGTVSSHNDHRIAMSAAIAAATLCTESVVITGAEAVEKSYPHFFEDLRALGGKWEEL